MPRRPDGSTSVALAAWEWMRGHCRDRLQRARARSTPTPAEDQTIFFLLCSWAARRLCGVYSDNSFIPSSPVYFHNHRVSAFGHLNLLPAVQKRCERPGIRSFSEPLEQARPVCQRKVSSQSKLESRRCGLRCFPFYFAHKCSGSATSAVPQAAAGRVVQIREDASSCCSIPHSSRPSRAVSSPCGATSCIPACM